MFRPSEKKVFSPVSVALSERSVACGIVEIRRAPGIGAACSGSGDGRRINRADVGQISAVPDTRVQIRRSSECRTVHSAVRVSDERLPGPSRIPRRGDLD